VSHNRTVAFEPVNTIFPRHVTPVVRQSEDGEREIVLMNWGFFRLEKGKAPRSVTNVRDDQIRTNPFWRDSFQKRRCLVPASCFCEPNGDVKPATWHWFALKGEDERPLFAFPGIWRRYQGPVKKDGPNVDIETYSFLTTTPNTLVSTINHERMPVLLTREEEFQTWLTGHAGGGVRVDAGIPCRPLAIVQEGYDKEDLLGGQPIERRIGTLL
jgi:putative SOS response-associated peptidase YedK